MAFQGNLREFSVTEILQLLGTQKKTGCLKLEDKERRAHFYVHEGRIISTREPGMSKDDPLLSYLLKIHRLSNEQYRGLVTIQRESSRDLEDLLVNGRYVEAEELAIHIERQILDDMIRIVNWSDGSYGFDANTRWPTPPLARLGVEAALIEVSRRLDEQKRFATLSRDPHQIVSVNDLPDAEDQLSEEECELFGIIDGQHTLAEIVEAAPLTEYEAYEALHRMMESGWVEVAGRRDPHVNAAAPGVTPIAVPVPAGPPTRQVLTRELALGLITIAITVGLAITARVVQPRRDPAAADVFAAARERDVRFVLGLYQRERGDYPQQLEELASDGWIAAGHLREHGDVIPYRRAPDGASYRLGSDPTATSPTEAPPGAR